MNLSKVVDVPFQEPSVHRNHQLFDILNNLATQIGIWYSIPFLLLIHFFEIIVERFEFIFDRASVRLRKSCSGHGCLCR
jgi:hypothetical protein